MPRHFIRLALAAGILTTAASCRHSCNTAASGRLMSGSKSTGACYDPAAGYTYPIGTPVSGMPEEYPGMLIPSNGVPLMPSPGPGGTAPNELPYPQPSGNIPPAGVPFAPPTTAPGDAGPNAVLPAPRPAFPVKNAK